MTFFGVLKVCLAVALAYASVPFLIIGIALAIYLGFYLVANTLDTIIKLKKKILKKFDK